MDTSSRQPSGVPAGGQFAASARDEVNVGALTGPTEASRPEEQSFEMEGIEALVADWREKLEEPEHYDRDDLAHIQRQIDEAEARKDHLRRMAASDPSTRFSALQAEWHQLNAATTKAAGDAMVDAIREAYPTAAFAVLEPSDQDPTNGMYVKSLRDADGNEIEYDEYDAEDFDEAGAWLPQSGDGWEHIQVPSATGSSTYGLVTIDLAT